MPVNHYECLILLDVTKTQGNTDAVKGQVQAILDKHGCEVLAARNWRKDEGKLAYPVHGHKRGLYYLTFFRAEAAKIDPIQADFRLNEHILRFMTQRIPESVSIWLLDWSVVTIMGKLRHLSYSRFNNAADGIPIPFAEGQQQTLCLSTHSQQTMREPAWILRAVVEGVKFCPRAG